VACGWKVPVFSQIDRLVAISINVKIGPEARMPVAVSVTNVSL